FAVLRVAGSTPAGCASYINDLQLFDFSVTMVKQL
ncbi:uncharacterized protein METZ01_LOCUS509989, partial [marine metagenome]